MNKAIVYSQNNCPACTTAKHMLGAAGYLVEERNISGPMYSKQDLFDKVPDARSVPQIFIGEEHIKDLPTLKTFLKNN